MTEREDALYKAISFAAAKIAAAYSAVRKDDGTRGTLSIHIEVTARGTGKWNAWTNITKPSDGTRYDFKGIVERPTPDERSDALIAELNLFGEDVSRPTKQRLYRRGKYANDELQGRIKALRETLKKPEDQ